MVAFVEPLDFQTIFVNILSGSGTYFGIIAIFGIICLAATFRMTGLTLGLMLFIFIMMFSGFIPASFPILIACIGGLLIGILVSRVVKN